MSTPDTATTAASEALARLRQGSAVPEPVSELEQRTVRSDSTSQPSSNSTRNLIPPKPLTAPKNPAHFEKVEPSAAPEAASKEQVSKRIAHPVPRMLPNIPTSLDQVLVQSRKDSSMGPTFRHMGQETKPSQAPVESVATPEALIPSPARETAAASGGFTLINDWLDSFKEPDWQAIGDKVYTAPQRFTARINKIRFERANAAELRERRRLLEEAHGEALAENTKRLAAQAALIQRLEAERLEAERIAEKIFQQDLLEQQRLEEERLATLQALEAAEQPTEQFSAPAALRQTLGHSAQPPAAKASLAPDELAALVSSAKESIVRHQAQVADEQPTEQFSAPAALRQTLGHSAQPPAAKPSLAPVELAALVSSAKESIARHQALVDPIYVPPYTVPDRSANHAPTSKDLLSRSLFTLAAIGSAFVAFWVTGDLASGSLVGQSSGSSLLSLAPTAYILLPVIFVGAALSAAHSWIPSQRSANRQRAVVLPFSAALVAAVLWLLMVKSENLVFACVAMILCVGLLLRCVTELNKHTARSTIERVFTDAPISLMTGFFLVLALASINEMLASWKSFEIPEIVAAVLVVGLGYLATSLAMTERGRIILATGFGWGMFWLLVPRLLGPNPSLWVAIMAGMAGFVVILATENRRYQIHHAEHRAARGKRTVF